MIENTKEDKLVQEKLKKIGLNLEKIPSSLLSVESINYKPIKSYEDNNYKVYKYVDVDDIQILVTPVDRLDDLNDKLKKAMPLAMYLNFENEEYKEQNEKFLEMLEQVNLEKIEKLEEEQSKISKQLPYEVKYSNNYIWQIYYSDIDNKYFMLYSSNENNSEALFYLIKKKLEGKNKKIYVPISHLEYSNTILKKTEIADLENYLWYFTKDWPNIYEVYNNKNELSIEIIGKAKVYETIKSTYKIILKDKKQADETFKLIKALFILQSNEEMEYDFKAIINEKGNLDFCYNYKKITYENLPEFLRQEVEIKQERAETLYNENIVITEKLNTLKETVEKQKDEYFLKEKQITTFLECKKSFFGRVRYFFKKGKKIKKNKENKDAKEKELTKELEQQEVKEEVKIEKFEKIESKEIYTIEDLLKVCEILSKEEIKFKNMNMDINALELKKESLERKIKNATLYINEIESHKKSLFDFWKFTNKDEANLLAKGDEGENKNQNKLKKTFNFEDEIEEFGRKVDLKQKEVFTKNECDAVFAIENDLNTFNILCKEKVLKKDDSIIEKRIKNLKQEYIDNIDIIREKAYDIFGNVAQDRTKIKILKNNKHREIEKDKYKILNINPNTTLEEYKDNLENYRKLLNEAYGKMQTPYDICIYKISKEELNKNYEIMDLNSNIEIAINNEDDEINFYKINVKEKMPVIFYSNIMFFDNLNKTLPDGMDIETKVLIDLSKFELKLVSRKDFYMNKTINEFENKIQHYSVYEYDIEVKK